MIDLKCNSDRSVSSVTQINLHHLKMSDVGKFEKHTYLLVLWAKPKVRRQEWIGEQKRN